MTRDELQSSQDDMLYCAHCRIAIDPGLGAMTYLVGAKEGFLFYHAGACTEAAHKDAGIGDQ
jgi:hypothetical protein